MTGGDPNPDSMGAPGRLGTSKCRNGNENHRKEPFQNQDYTSSKDATRHLQPAQSPCSQGGTNLPIPSVTRSDFAGESIFGRVC